MKLARRQVISMTGQIPKGQCWIRMVRKFKGFSCASQKAGCASRPQANEVPACLLGKLADGCEAFVTALAKKLDDSQVSQTLQLLSYFWLNMAVGGVLLACQRSAILICFGECE